VQLTSTIWSVRPAQAGPRTTVAGGSLSRPPATSAGWVRAAPP